MRSVRVALGERSYSVHIGRGALRELEQRLAHLRGRRLVLVASRRVYGLHARRLSALARLGPLQRILVPDGERHKNTRTWARIVDALVAAGVGRDAVLGALGGGVVGDLAGFVAATYMRGIDFVQIPSTLLSMVDSSVGGKVGVNHPAAKNLIGAFHQPLAVLADLALLHTLPAREFQSGAYELLKCGLIGNRALFGRVARYGARLADWPADELERAVAAAVRLKARVVAADEREGGLRRVLNLGHTLGHALEAVTSYRRFTHGEAVGWGLIAAAHLAAGRALVTPAEERRIVAAVDALGPRPAIADLDRAGLLAALAHDKKARAGRVPFILPKGIGAVTIVNDVSNRELERVLSVLQGARARLRRA